VFKTQVKNKVKKVREALAEGNVEAAQAAYRDAQKRIDQAGAHSVLHPNRAARIKSRLEASIKKVQAGSAS
jgi:small subunit ribosomal protein S20